MSGFREARKRFFWMPTSLPKSALRHRVGATLRRTFKFKGDIAFRAREKSGGVIKGLKQYRKYAIIEKARGGTLMVYETVKCSYCGGGDVVLYGKSSTEKQQYMRRNTECTHKIFQLESTVNNLGYKFTER